MRHFCHKPKTGFTRNKIYKIESHLADLNYIKTQASPADGKARHRAKTNATPNQTRRALLSQPTKGKEKQNQASSGERRSEFTASESKSIAITSPAGRAIHPTSRAKAAERRANELEAKARFWASIFGFRAKGVAALRPRRENKKDAAQNLSDAFYSVALRGAT